MALKEQINNDLKAALLGGDRFVGEVLRGLKAVILNEEVAQSKRESGLEDAAIEQLIAKEVKKRAESAATYDQAERPELSEIERKEAEVLRGYLPTQLSEAELLKVVDEVVATLGATDAKAMGQVIGAVKAKVGTSADGALIAKLVKQALN